MKDPATGVKIGCFGGFWGDSMAHAVGQFLRSREAESIDYLVSDYLAEVTMCILSKKKKETQRRRQQQAAAAAKGQAPLGTAGAIDDFATQIWKPFGLMLMQKNIRVVVNAGGLDPLGLKALVESLSASFPEEHKPVIAAVLGDDLLATTPAASGSSWDPAQLREFRLDGGASVDSVARPTALPDGTSAPLPATPLTANAYIGCGGIVAALRAGAHVVITGRVVDSAMVLGPLVHEHRWDLRRDHDLIAAGTLAGHVIECGAQCTGGNFTDWELALQLRGKGGRLFENIGFPLVEVQADGKFVVTKPSGTGGIVSRLSVAEQLVYEIGDPSAYIVADAVCDFRGATLTEVGKNRVAVEGVRGRPATGFYKVTTTFADGYLAHFTFAVVGPGALFKAKAIAKSVVGRAQRVLVSLAQPPYRATRVEYFGAGVASSSDGTTSAATSDGTTTSAAPSDASQQQQQQRRLEQADEVVVRISAHHSNPKLLMLIAAGIPSASTGMSPGLFALTSARSMPSEAIAMRSALVPASNVAVRLAVSDGAIVPVDASLLPTTTPTSSASTDGARPIGREPKGVEAKPTVRAPLYTVACCRSGDKADAANVGVVCRRPGYLPLLETLLTPEVVQRHLAAWFDENAAVPAARRVERFTLPGVGAMNFVLSHVLGGGGLVSLKADKQGKSIGSLLSGLELDLPAAWVDDYAAGVGAAKARIRARL